MNWKKFFIGVILLLSVIAAQIFLLLNGLLIAYAVFAVVTLSWVTYDMNKATNKAREERYKRMQEHMEMEIKRRVDEEVTRRLSQSE